MVSSHQTLAIFLLKALSNIKTFLSLKIFNRCSILALDHGHERGKIEYGPNRASAFVRGIKSFYRLLWESAKYETTTFSYFSILLALRPSIIDGGWVPVIQNILLFQTDIKKKRIREQTDYEDLREAPQEKKAALKLAKDDRYLTGPTPVASNLTSGSDTDIPYLPPDDARYEGNLVNVWLQIEIFDEWYT